jgi:dihydrofolate synthase/folylpolyglutamate synthase
MQFPSIHVAGSNGKGSTSALLANAYTLAGQTTGLFTSPHLCFVEERIRLDGRPISRKKFDHALGIVRDALVEGPTLEVTFFEATFLVAMVIFAEECVDRAVIETGLGGRLDATRCCAADACVLTEIALEHTDILGSDLATIAGEKAAIARPGVPLIARWPYDADVRSAIESAVTHRKNGYWWRTDRLSLLRFDEANLPFRPLPEGTDFDGSPSMREDTLFLAIAVLQVMDEGNVLEHVFNAAERTVWPGRMQIIEGPHNTQLLLDCAHNPSGMMRLVDDLLHRADLAEERNSEFTPEVLLLGATKQSDLFAFLHPVIELVAHIGVQHIVIAEPKTGRSQAIRAEQIKESLLQQNSELNIEIVRDPGEALDHAAQIANRLADAITPSIPLVKIVSKSTPDDDDEAKGFVWAFGSLYLIGDIFRSMGQADHAAMDTLLSNEMISLGEKKRNRSKRSNSTKKQTGNDDGKEDEEE